jgi:hypothetical protein
MNWEAIGAIGQVASALALVFVLVQVRHARETMEHAARQDRLDASRELWLTLAVHPEVATLIPRVNNAAGGEPGLASQFVEYTVGLGLTASEGQQLYSYIYGFWTNVEGSIASVGRLGSGMKIALDQRIADAFSRGNAPFGTWYQSMKSRLNPDAVRYVDNVLARRRPDEPPAIQTTLQ